MNLASNEKITIPKEIKERLHLNMDVNRSSGTISISFLLECSDLGRYVCKVHKGDYSYQGGQDLKRKLQVIIIKYEENLENIKQEVWQNFETVTSFFVYIEDEKCMA